MWPPAELADVIAVAGALTDRFTARGFRLYLVGGVVRDPLAGRPVAGDVDLTTDARPEQTREVLAGWPLVEALWTQGERFGTIGCRVAGRSYEITTHRAEVYAAASRKPAVDFSDDVEADLSRRDFTVNAMAVELPSGDLVDPFGGRVDLAEGVLRTPLGPETSFSDDPLRMVRAARFAATHELAPAPDVVVAMADMADRLGIVAVERIRTELDRLLAAARPSVGLELLAETGLLGFLLPEHAAGPQDRRAATFAAVDAVHADRDADLLTARLAVLLDGWADPARRLRGLRSSNEQVAAVAAVVRAVGVVRAAEGGSAAARRFAAAAGGRRTAARAAAGALCDTDTASTLGRELDALEGRGDLDDLAPQLDGEQVMELLGIGPGPAVGEALGFLADLRLDEGRLPDDVVEARLVAWWVDHQPGPGAG